MHRDTSFQRLFFVLIGRIVGYIPEQLIQLFRMCFQPKTFFVDIHGSENVNKVENRNGPGPQGLEQEGGLSTAITPNESRNASTPPPFHPTTRNPYVAR